MEELCLALRVFLSAVFVSSAVSKLKDWNAHLAVVAEYRMVPVRWNSWMARLDPIAELLAGLLLFIGYQQPLALFLLIGLLFVYGTAIGTNLVRGRRDLSCGCGGLAGNHPISWFLVLRNGFLVGLALFVGWHGSCLFSLDDYLESGGTNRFFGGASVVIILSTWMVMLLGQVLSEWIPLVKSKEKA